MGKILVADDEAHILGLMCDILEEVGHSVTGVRDGQAALDLLKSDFFDVAIIDVVMPKVDGYHVAASIQAMPKPPRIVIVTSRDFERDKRAIQAAGADAFLPKPFSASDLVEVVSTLLKSRR